MSTTDLFSPIGTKSITATAGGSLNVLLTTGNGYQCRVFNSDATATTYVAFGVDSTITATSTGSTPVGPGEVAGFSIPDGDGVVYAAAIASAGTPVVYFTRGNGT